MEQLKYILLSVVFISVSYSKAQSVPRYIGISGGIVSNVLVGSEVDFQKKIYNNTMSHRTGPAISIFLKKEFTARWFIKYELAYIRKGNSSNNAGFDLNTEYISIPLKFGFQPVNFLNTKKFQFSIEGGPSVNFEPGHGTDSLKHAYSGATNSNINKFVLGVQAGSNLEYRLSKKRIVFLNYTFYHDLTSTLSYDAGNVTYKASNQGWMLTAGVLFQIH